MDDSKINFPQEFTVPNFAVTVQNQGNRGTCIAFSTAALIEYYLGGKKISPQFLYAWCKYSDSPEKTDKSGTLIETAFKVLSERGAIRAEEWPYNSCSADNEAQIPQERLCEFSPAHHFTDTNFHMLYTPTNVGEYKSILCGMNGNKPMPIVVGCELFKPVEIKNDWLEIPLSYAEPAGGHAVLIYGYRDVSTAAGGGYFLAQNSWGTQWYRGNSGLLKIPYEYIQNFARSAGTILEKTENVKSAAAPVENNVSSRILMAQKLVQELNTACQFATQFRSAMDKNAFSRQGCIVPNRKKNFLKDFMGFRERFNHCGNMTSFNESWLKSLEEGGFIPCIQQLHPSEQALLKGANFFQAYELSSRKSTCYILAFFVTPVNVKDGSVSSGSTLLYQHIKSFVKQWKQLAGVISDGELYFSIATAKTWDVNAVADKECLCSPSDYQEDVWDTVHQHTNSLNMSELDMLYCLYPQTFSDICVKIQRFIYIHSDNQDVTVSTLSQTLHLDKRYVEKCCDDMQMRKTYVNYITSYGEKAIKKPEKDGSVPFRKVYHSQATLYEKITRDLNIMVILTALSILMSAIIHGDYTLMKLNELGNVLDLRGCGGDWLVSVCKEPSLLKTFYQENAAVLAFLGLILMGIRGIIKLLSFLIKKKQEKILFR